MKNHLRKILLRCSPSLFYAISSVRFFKRCKARYEKFQKRFVKLVYQGRPITVLSGSFEGMPYYNKVIWGPITSKWIGSYEEELQGVIDEILAGSYQTLIDVGAAEGYYAVGFAYKCPDAKVISYDIDPIARYRQKQLASLVGIDNLEILKYCDHQELSLRITEKSFVMTDVEGFELELLDPVKCAFLKSCDILVEIHRSGDVDIPEVEKTIAERFEKSHVIKRFGVEPRNAAAWRQRIPALEQCSVEEIAFALDEGRMSHQCWLWMKVGHP